jgi:uncharacterized protein (UPF0548 family)
MLPSHVERAEERFTVEGHAADDPVFYDVFAFARPARPVSQGGSIIRTPGTETVRSRLSAGYGRGRKCRMLPGPSAHSGDLLGNG